MSRKFSSSSVTYFRGVVVFQKNHYLTYDYKKLTHRTTKYFNQKHKTLEKQFGKEKSGPKAQRVFIWP